MHDRITTGKDAAHVHRPGQEKATGSCTCACRTFELREECHAAPHSPTGIFARIGACAHVHPAGGNEPTHQPAQSTKAQRQQKSNLGALLVGVSRAGEKRRPKSVLSRDMMCTLLTSGATVRGPASVGAATKLQSTTAVSARADVVRRGSMSYNLRPHTPGSKDIRGSTGMLHSANAWCSRLPRAGSPPRGAVAATHTAHAGCGGWDSFADSLSKGLAKQHPT